MSQGALSKIIEALESVRAFAKKDPVSPTPPSSKTFQNPNLNVQDSEKKPQSAPSQYQMTQQELADVYFARSGKTAKPAPQPTLIRVEDKRRTFVFPWIVTTFALILCSLALFSTKRVMISIQVYDTDAPAAAPQSRPASGSHVSGGRQIRIAPQRFAFSSGAQLSSSVGKENVTLSNRSDRDHAYAVVDFDPAFNAKGYALQFEAKGAAGGETLEIVLSDTRRQSSLNTGPIRPFPIGLTTRWERAEVRVPSGAGFDASRIAQMRFDVGSRRTGNPANTSVQIRNARWVPVAE